MNQSQFAREHSLNYDLKTSINSEKHHHPPQNIYFPSRISEEDEEYEQSVYGNKDSTLKRIQSQL